MAAVGSQLFQIQAFDDVDAAFDQQVDVDRHVGIGHLFEGDGIGTGGEDAAAAEPTGSSRSGTGAVDLGYKTGGVVPEAGPTGADQDDVAGADLDAGGGDGGVEVVGGDFEILREVGDARLRGDIEEDAAAEDGRDGVDGVTLDASGVRLQASHGLAAIQLAAARKVTQGIDVSADVTAQGKTFGGGAIAVAGDIVAVFLVEGEEVGGVIGVVRHAGVIRLREIVDARGLEGLKELVHRVFGTVFDSPTARYNRSKRVKITISKENYLKAIAEAESEGETVKAATLSRWLNVTAPAVTMAIKRLKRDTLIEVGEEGHITLTVEGREIANRILNRHHLIERMLTEIFDMEWYKVHEEAEQLEHAVSGDFERKLLEKLGAGEACPHGNRVGVDTPSDRRRRGLKTLDESKASEAVAVTSVYERDRQVAGVSGESGCAAGIAGQRGILERGRYADATRGWPGCAVRAVGGAKGLG